MQTKHYPVLQEFSRALRKALGDNLESIVLFGSRARGDPDQWSDYDLMVLVDRETPGLREELLRVATDSGSKHDALVSALLYKKDQFDSDRYEPLFMNIRKEGIAIWTRTPNFQRNLV
ncbi:MAG: nucleotidyltransferase domain-containing protein [Chloroflexi bacterium]|nr:nucleotidyltransferase domain-containing protein [Chloroflexota bacterium]